MEILVPWTELCVGWPPRCIKIRLGRTPHSYFDLLTKKIPVSSLKLPLQDPSNYYKRNFQFCLNVSYDVMSQLTHYSAEPTTT
jgi:hypothetical protein